MCEQVLDQEEFKIFSFQLWANFLPKKVAWCLLEAINVSIIWPILGSKIFYCVPMNKLILNRKIGPWCWKTKPSLAWEKHNNADCPLKAEKDRTGREKKTQRKKKKRDTWVLRECQSSVEISPEIYQYLGSFKSWKWLFKHEDGLDEWEINKKKSYK